ncbi:hypothetical protein LCGC14_1873180 [marine sediment metagenome]|uniref:Uncharacterized protein n=1 Tax=marine sediment metagenome TaxID=412755 RepID=A0A0F9GSG8_9ZZZZ
MSVRPFGWVGVRVRPYAVASRRGAGGDPCRCCRRTYGAHIYYIGVREDRVASAAFTRVCREFYRILTQYWQCWRCGRPSYQPSAAYIDNQRGIACRARRFYVRACDPTVPQLCRECNAVVQSTSIAQRVDLRCDRCDKLIVYIGPCIITTCHICRPPLSRCMSSTIGTIRERVPPSDAPLTKRFRRWIMERSRRRNDADSHDEAFVLPWSRVWCQRPRPAPPIE